MSPSRQIEGSHTCSGPEPGHETHLPCGDVRIGNTLILVGAGLLIVGALVKFFPGAFAWFGNLPGDIRIEGENSRVFIPITSMIVVSIVLTLVVNLVAPFFRDR